jgi:tetratricopeptide (TPR) repeat protein
MAWTDPYHSRTGDALSPVLYVVRFPAYLMWQMWGFFVSWWETRELRRLLQGLPALLLAGLLLLLLASRGQPASRELIDKYLQLAQRSVRLEEFDQAEFYYRKLEQLAPANGTVRFEHASMFAEKGEFDRAAVMMGALVSDDDRSNDKDVHLWLARNVLEGKIKTEDPLGFAKEHLNQVLAEDSRNLQAHFFFSQLYLRQGDLDEAIRHLEPVAPNAPQLQMLLASLHGLRGDKSRARSTARNAALALEQAINSNQSSDVAVWHQLAGAQLLQENYEEAVNVLRRALTKFDDKESRVYLGRTYVRWSDHVARESPEKFSEQMWLLQQALLVAPDEPTALQRVVALATSTGPAAEEAQTRLREILANGDAPAAVHLALGTLAAAHKDTETALRHLRQAHQLNPKTPVTLNNLAFVIANSPEPDLSYALQLAEQAIELAPGVPSFRETRGQILIKLGKMSEGIADLEGALPHMPSEGTRLAMHSALAKAYQELGDDKLAALHRQRAQELEQQIKLQPSPAPTFNPVELFQLDEPSTGGASGTQE